jgi:DNA-binding NarL/FixJ family response regulator
MIRVLIVDDHAIVRGGLAQLLGTTDDLSLVGRRPTGSRPWRLPRTCGRTWC